MISHLFFICVFFSSFLLSFGVVLPASSKLKCVVDFMINYIVFFSAEIAMQYTLTSIDVTARFKEHLLKQNIKKKRQPQCKQQRTHTHIKKREKFSEAIAINKILKGKSCLWLNTERERAKANDFILGLTAHRIAIEKLRC